MTLFRSNSTPFVGCEAIEKILDRRFAAIEQMMLLRKQKERQHLRLVWSADNLSDNDIDR